MSWKIIGYTPEGRAIREDEGPSRAHMAGIRGALIVGGPGPNDAAVLARRKLASKAKNAARLAMSPEARRLAYERTKRYRESKRRAA